MLKSLFGSIGQMALFGAKAMRDAWAPPFEGEYLVTQFYEIGVGSFFLVVASGFALGVVMTLHTRSTLVQFGATADIPVFQSLAFFNEIGPLVTALLMAGRVGAGIGAQLANMRATEQIDAIETLSVDSFKLLVVTRVIACTVMLPLLTMFMDAAGIFGGFLSEHLLVASELDALHAACLRRSRGRRFPSPYSQDRGVWLSHRRRSPAFMATPPTKAPTACAKRLPTVL